jgi:phospholipase B1
MMNMTFDRDDFTVVVQPLLANSTQVPRTVRIFQFSFVILIVILQPDGKPDLSFFTPDCFHFSAKLHSIVARGLWNNIVTPVGSKVSNFGLDNANASLLCPDPVSQLPLSFIL